MNKLIVALIAGTFAAVAGAQAPAPMTKQEKAKAVEATTKAGAEGAATSSAADAKGSAEAAKMKGTPKALPTKADKAAAAKATTAARFDQRERFQGRGRGRRRRQGREGHAEGAADQGSQEGSRGHRDQVGRHQVRELTPQEGQGPQVPCPFCWCPIPQRAARSNESPRCHASAG